MVKVSPKTKTYPIRERIRPFVRGLMRAKPLVEVALGGLEREEVPSRTKAVYTVRIMESGSLRDIQKALMRTREGSAGEGPYRQSPPLPSHLQEVLVGEFYARVRRQSHKEQKISAGIAHDLLTRGNVTSPEAQFKLIEVVCVRGSDEQIKSLEESEHSQIASEILSKITYQLKGRR